MQFPDLRGESLAGQPFSSPQDFAGARTIALVAFDLKQRAEIQTWEPFIDGFARDGRVRARLFAVLPRSMQMMRGAIVATLRKGAPNAQTREATIALFVDVDAFCAALGIADRGAVHAFVIEPDGSISEHRQGPFTDMAATAITARVTSAP